MKKISQGTYEITRKLATLIRIELRAQYEEHVPSFPAFFSHRFTAGTTSGLNVELTVYFIRKRKYKVLYTVSHLSKLEEVSYSDCNILLITMFFILKILNHAWLKTKYTSVIYQYVKKIIFSITHI